MWYIAMPLEEPPTASETEVRVISSSLLECSEQTCQPPSNFRSNWPVCIAWDDEKEGGQMAGFDMIVSDCSQSVRRNGADIQIRIYRLEHEREWSVEIVETEALSTFWDATYSSEQAALQAAMSALYPPPLVIEVQ